MGNEEVILVGGNVNASVVRIGNTVRRKITTASAAIHQLLLHLEKKGVPSTPRFLGVDEQGREILTFLDGETGIPPIIWQHDEPLIAAAKMLRQYHDATLDFDQHQQGRWAYYYPDDRRHEVICHNDFAPYNMVYHNGIPNAMIDFDLAGPGPRLKDVSYAAYWFVPLSFNSADQVAFAESDVNNGGRRLRLFCETYGISIEKTLFDMIAEVLTLMSSEEQMQEMVGIAAANKLKQDGHLAHWERELHAFLRHRERIEQKLLQ